MSAARSGRPGARPVVAIDLATMHPGRGGAGGGIWSYARHLVQELDAIAPGDVDVVCLAHRDLPLDGLGRVRVARVEADTRSIAGRLRWVHVGLPAWCARHDVRLLHKLATEIPVALPDVRLVATVQDFMAEHYLARGYAAGDAAARLRRSYFARITRRCFARADRVVTSSRAVADEARRRFPTAAGRIVVVPHGVAHAERGTPHRLVPPGVAGRLLCVGMFARHKGQHHAVRAVERLAERAPAVAERTTLTLRGFAEDPAYHAEVRAAAARSPAAARIRFVDYAPTVGPGGIYADADLLLFLSEYEGFGLPLLEAQAAGVAVVCSDIPAFREVAGDGACFVPPADADAVAAAIEGLATDAAARRALVGRGRANARRYSWARTAAETLTVYRGLLR